MLRAGDHAFDRERDRGAFEQHLTRITTGHDAEQGGLGAHYPRQRQLSDELNAISQRLEELRQRRKVLRAEIETSAQPGDLHTAQARRELRELEGTIEELGRYENELRGQAARPTGS